MQNNVATPDGLGGGELRLIWDISDKIKVIGQLKDSIYKFSCEIWEEKITCRKRISRLKFSSRLLP